MTARALLAAALVAAVSLPAQAEVVYLKDGRRLEGAIAIEDTRMTVSQADGTKATVPYDEVQGVSLDGEELYPQRAATPAWVTWTVAGANLVAVATAIYWLVRPSAVTPGRAP